MIARNIILFTILIAGYSLPGQAASSSMSCVWINGQQKCAFKEDPNGNVAAGAAGINGDQGLAAAGAGNPYNFNTDYQQIGNGGIDNGAGAGNGNYLPPNFGNGGGVAVGAGNGYPFGFGPFFPPWNGNPFDFVQDFMRNRGKR